LIWVSLYLGFAVLIAATLAGFLGEAWWFFALFSHFRVQYLAALSGFTLIFILVGKPIAGWVSGGFVLLNLVLVLPLYFQRQEKKVTGSSHRLLLANVNTANPHHSKVKCLILEQNPDLIVLIEVDQGWLDDLGLADLGYIFTVAEPRGDNYGIALYSRVPLISREVARFGPLQMPTLCASLRLGGSVLNLIGSHPPPPKSGQLARYRDQQLAEIMDYATTLEGEVIFCGDLNMTSWMPAFKHFLERGDLFDTRQGFGIQPTWPTWMPLLLVPLDHIWISGNIRVHSRRVGPRVGSDHRPVVLDFLLQEGQ